MFAYEQYLLNDIKVFGFLHEEVANLSDGCQTPIVGCAIALYND